MMHGLKVCPFCGERPAVNSWQAENGKTMYIIECENSACAIRPMTDYHAKISVIAEEWNRRAECQTTA